MNGFAPPGPPPSIWQEAKAQDGRTYYFHRVTNATSWEKPAEMMSDNERALMGTHWTEHKTPEGKPYWHNTETKETTWNMPAIVKQNMHDSRQAQHPPQRPPAASPSAWATGPSSHSGYGQRHNERDDYQPQERRDRDREAGYGVDRSTVAFGSAVEVQFSNPEEAENAFLKVLKQHKVQPDWDWIKAMRACIKDPHWRAIPEPEKRHEVFKKYCDQLRSMEKRKEQERQNKMRIDFTAMLRSHPEIVHYTRWKTALPIIEDESIFRAAKDDTERRALFDGYIATLKRAHADKEAEDRKSALEELKNTLHGLELEPFTRWRTAEEKLQQKQFESKNFLPLTRSDLLASFQKHIKTLQREYNDRVQSERLAKYRIERKNRDAFKLLLNELRSAGLLKAGTKWKEIHALIDEDPRYLSMLGQSGSTPLELFWDALEEEEGKFRTLRRYALDVLEQQRFEVVTTTSFEEFLAVMRTNPRTNSIDESSMSSIYAYVIGKVKRREEEERHNVESNERYAMEDFRSVLKRLEPPILVTDTWEAVLPRVEKSDEYRAIKLDSLRQSVFDKYIRRLKEKESDRRERSRRDTRDRDRGDRERRERDREYRNGHSDSHRRHRTRSRSPEQDSYAADRRVFQQGREARHRNIESTGLSPPYRRDRERDRDDHHRYERTRQGSGDHYHHERREREVERERSYNSRADVSELDYGGELRPLPARRRRDSNDSASGRRENKRAKFSPPHDRRSKTPAQQLPKEDPGLRSGSEEGEIEED